MLSILNDYFDEIYCINLNKRPDRWETVQREFSKHHLGVTRFPAIDGDLMYKNPNLKPGEFGCLLSHRSILEIAYSKKHKNILILEDDVEFHEDLNKKFSCFISQVPTWDLLYFGANHSLCNSYETIEPIKVSDNVYQLNHGYALHAYAVNLECYASLMSGLTKMNQPIDVLYSNLHKTLKCFVFRPHLAWQRPGYSDIMKSQVNYDFLKR